MALIETAKRDNIPEDTIKSWYMIAKEMNWSEEDIDKKMAGILKRKSYGNDTVRIDDFFVDEKTFTESECKAYVNKAITAMFRKAKMILEYNGKDPNPQKYFMDFFKIKNADIKILVADAIIKRYAYERQFEIEEIISKEIELHRKQTKERRKRLNGLPLTQRQNIIKLLIERKIISVNTPKEEQLMVENIGIFAGDVTEEEIESVTNKPKYRG